MSSPASSLPPPPPDLKGWPWEVDTAPVENLSTYPRITIVTPSYSQGKFIERTIRSVLMQGYPNLEYFVMDAGSTDETVSILKKYDSFIAGWVSEKDAGQADAINKGLARASGEIWAWINSDDWYAPGAFHAVAKAFLEHPEVKWVHGEVLNIRSSSTVVKHHRPQQMSAAACLGRHQYAFHQPGMFWSASLLERAGPLNPKLHFSFDHDLWLRMLLMGEQPYLLHQPVASFQLHGASKSYGARRRFTLEDREVFALHAPNFPPQELQQARRWLRENEADVLLDTIYAQLALGRRGEAIATLGANLGLLRLVEPRKAILGLAWRTLVTGRAPSWFRTHQG